MEKRTQELRIAEAETARGEKLASVGLLAAGIAHELNNPLTGMLTFSHLLRKKMPDGSPDAEDLDLVIRETKRCAAIITQAARFRPRKDAGEEICRPQPDHRGHGAHHRAPGVICATSRSRWISTASLPPVWVDADLIKQVIMNMLVNAQHAIEDEGQHHRPQPPLAASPRARSRARRRCRWWRSRSSTPAAASRRRTCKRIFDPFFTSKEVGKGHRAGPVRQPRHRQGARRGDRGGKHGRGGIHVPHLSSRWILPRETQQRKQREQAMSARILVVDDEEIVIRSCLRILGERRLRGGGRAGRAGGAAERSRRAITT